MDLRPKKPASRRIEVTDVPKFGSYEESARYVHEEVVGGVVFANVLNQIERLLPTLKLEHISLAYFRDMLQRIGPRDPTEEMIAMQMILTHARVMHLTYLACTEDSFEGIRILNEYTDRASNTFRRLSKALDEHRTPRATTIQQTNVAAHQLVQNAVIGDENATNKQGCQGGQAAVSTDGCRAHLTSGFSSADTTVGARNRAAKS